MAGAIEHLFPDGPLGLAALRPARDRGPARGLRVEIERVDPDRAIRRRVFRLDPRDSDRDLRAAILSHVGSRYTACFYLPVPSAKEAYAEECRLWHEMGGMELDSGDHPVPPGDHACPVCE